MGVRTEPIPQRHSSTGIRAVVQRWPSAVALVLVALIWPTGAESTVRALAELLVVLPLIYLVTAALGRPASTWAVFGVLGVVFGLLAAQDAVPTTAVLSVVAVLAVGLAQRTRRVDRAFLLQVAGFVVFAAIAVAAQHVDLGWARVLVAAGWIGHGLWDYEHRHAHRTVARSFAEFCGLVDVLVGVAVLVVP